MADVLPIIIDGNKKRQFNPSIDTIEGLSGLVEDTIVNGVVDKAPSQNAVFDALSLKANIAGGNDFTEEQTITNNNSGTPPLTNINENSGSFIPVAHMYTPNMTSGQRTVVKFGRENSAGNAGDWNFFYQGVGDSANRVDFGFAFDADPAFSYNFGKQLGIGTTAPDDSAKVQIDSTTQGFLPPRMTSAQRDAISSPAQGLIVYDTDLNTICYFDGAVWLFELTRVCSNNQSTTSTTYADVTELVTPTLPTGRYKFEFSGTCQSTATGTGVGVRLGSAGTIGAIVAEWTISIGANGRPGPFSDGKNYDYSQLSQTTNVTSTGVLTSNADFPVTGKGVFSLSSPAAVAAQIRTENGGTGISMRINSSLQITRITA